MLGSTKNNGIRLKLNQSKTPAIYSYEKEALTKADALVGASLIKQSVFFPF